MIKNEGGVNLTGTTPSFMGDANPMNYLLQNMRGGGDLSSMNPLNILSNNNINNELMKNLMSNYSGNMNLNPSLMLNNLKGMRQTSN
jgi:hypothetical protein